MDTLKEHFKVNTPIFRTEIRALFPQYSSIYVYQLIKREVDKGTLVHYSMGIYFIPTQTIAGTTTLAPRNIAIKRFIEDNGNRFGVFAGIMLQNLFNCTTQVPATLEIVSNNESSKGREIEIHGMRFIVHKSRVEITNDNYRAYTILQLFTDDGGDDLGENGLEAVNHYIQENNISKGDIVSLAKYFPARTMKNMICQGVI